MAKKKDKITNEGLFETLGKSCRPAPIFLRASVVQELIYFISENTDRIENLSLILSSESFTISGDIKQLSLEMKQALVTKK